MSLGEAGGEAAALKGKSMNGRMNVRSVWVVGAMAMLVVGAMVVAGPITPPSGAIAPTGRTLDEIYNRVPAVGGADGRTPIPPPSRKWVLLRSVCGSGDRSVAAPCPLNARP